MQNNKRRIIRNAGFTLAETLLAVLILLMVSTIVANGIPAAKNAYEKVIVASNAEVLLSTTTSSLRNELDLASDITIPDGVKNGNTITGKSIVYYNPNRKSTSMLFGADGISDTDADGQVIPVNTLMFHRYYSKDGLVSVEYKATRLVTKERATENLYVTFEEVSYDEETDIISFKNLSVNRESGSTGLATLPAFSIHLLS